MTEYMYTVYSGILDRDIDKERAIERVNNLYSS